jgi:adenine-specific DNA-methyltransferase
MMYPRLKLLQKLLSDDGAIFISIYDNENANLRLLCNEIFGEINFIDTIIWQKIYTIKNSAQYFSGMHDYIIAYSKKKTSFVRNLLPRSKALDNTYTNPDNDPRGPWTTNAVQARNFYSQGSYEIVSPNGKIFLPPTGTYWRISLESFQQLDSDKRIWWGKNGNSVPRIKKFLSEAKQGVVPATLWLYNEVGQNADAKQEVRNILQGSDEFFPTPKPVSLVERILQIATDKDSIILDSFAGSGTTAHAVLNVNRQDGGNRKFILVEMEDYAETITAERVRRVVDGYAGVEGAGGSFGFYELGEPMILEDGNLNENVPVERIREYVFYMETKLPLPKTPERAASGPTGNPHYLGGNANTDYYFYYERNCITTLDRAFLGTLNNPAEGYVIYADKCKISPEDLKKFGVVFKKIPRDIARL